MNALFYNLNTGEIEDFTGQGLTDLQEGILRTPLPALQTFKDDPLRMLRAVRFASRLNFHVTEDICRGLITVAYFLSTKVTNERIGDEITGCLQGKHPDIALEMIVNHEMASDVFKVPDLQRPVDWYLGIRIVNEFLSEIERTDFQFGSPEVRVSALLAAFLFPLFEHRVA